MSVVIETTMGNITVDLYIKQRPQTCRNFLKLCKLKYYNYNLFHTVQRGFIAQTGDPTGSGRGGESIYGALYGEQARYYEGEKAPRIKHTKVGTLSMVNCGEGMVGSQFFITLDENLTYLDGEHIVFGEVAEGFEVLEKINEAICDETNRPYQDIRVSHTVILEDPFEDPRGMEIPERSPSPSPQRMMGGRIAADEEIDDLKGKSMDEIEEIIKDKEAKSRATILEMVGDLPDADVAPPENVLFVCKLNPVTSDEDLMVIFSRFGKIKGCEVIRDQKSGESLQYAFIEFEDKKACEDAYFKMDNVLIDDRRIHVDFSQSVSKYRWKGKGRGVEVFDDAKPVKKAPAPWIQRGKDDNSYSKYSNYDKPGGSKVSESDSKGSRYFNKNKSEAGKHQWSRSPPRYSRGHATEQKRRHRDRETREAPSDVRLLELLKKELKDKKKKKKKKHRKSKKSKRHGDSSSSGSSSSDSGSSSE